MSWRLVGAAVPLLAVGCVGGSDTSDAATIGSLGGPCFANNTCNTGLVCVLVSGKGVCQESDAGGGGDATVDQSVAETSTSDAGDASDAYVDACAITLGVGRACQNVCTGTNNLCCEQSSMCVSSGQCTTPVWACQTSSECPNNGYCCAVGAAIDLSSCPPSGQLQPSSTATCQASCPSNTTATCLISSECPPNKTCVGVQITGVNTALGFCQ